MSKIRSRRTRPEMVFHGILKGGKVKHRMWPDLPGRPDCLIFPRTAVFVNGCFWHGCPKHFRCPKTNRVFWALKIKRNARRQKEVFYKLRKEGWMVVVIWEHDLKGKVKFGKLMGKK
jgi:DNA mismatch endonuclease (patch repair protein)